MINHRQLILIALLWWPAAVAFSQDEPKPAAPPTASQPAAVVQGSPDRQPVTLENTEVRLLRSKIVGQDLKLFVARPFRPPVADDGKFPVLYLLDAEMSFPLVQQIVLSLQSGFEMPPVLIVGIGYPGGFRENSVRRTRDYTPTPDPVFTKFARRWGGSDGTSGEAASFLRFIREELKPFVEASYPANPDDATIFGASFGGLFATYALLEAPDTFQRYVIGSPSLWWDKRVIFELEKQYAAAHENLHARVFIGAGGHETDEHEREQLAKLPEAVRRPVLDFQKAIDGAAQMVEAIEPFVATLAGRNYPGLDLTLHVFPGETHGSVQPMVASRGLKTVFASP
ncbi:MAG: alpha/beta hydrolase-fold protein [Acidobacteriota bacterium]